MGDDGGFPEEQQTTSKARCECVEEWRRPPPASVIRPPSHPPAHIEVPRSSSNSSFGPSPPLSTPHPGSHVHNGLLCAALVSAASSLAPAAPMRYCAGATLHACASVWNGLREGVCVRDTVALGVVDGVRELDGVPVRVTDGDVVLVREFDGEPVHVGDDVSVIDDDGVVVGETDRDGVSDGDAVPVDDCVGVATGVRVVDGVRDDVRVTDGDGVRDVVSVAVRVLEVVTFGVCVCDCV